MAKSDQSGHMSQEWRFSADRVTLQVFRVLWLFPLCVAVVVIVHGAGQRDSTYGVEPGNQIQHEQQNHASSMKQTHMSNTFVPMAYKQ